MLAIHVASRCEIPSYFVPAKQINVKACSMFCVVQVSMAMKNSGRSRREYKTRSYRDLGIEAAASNDQENGKSEKEEL